MNPVIPEPRIDPSHVTSEQELADAKSRLHVAAKAIDPLAPLRQHPFTTVAVAGISGFLLGSKDHPAIMKTVRLSLSATNVLKPALLAAGKFAAGHLAKKSAEAAADAANNAPPATDQPS